LFRARGKIISHICRTDASLVGKVAFKTLQDEEIEKLRQKGEYTGEDEYADLVTCS